MAFPSPAGEAGYRPSFQACVKRAARRRRRNGPSGLVEDALHHLDDHAVRDVDQQRIGTVANPLVAIGRHGQVVVPVVVDVPLGLIPAEREVLAVEPGPIIEARRTEPAAVPPVEAEVRMHLAREEFRVEARPVAVAAEVLPTAFMIATKVSARVAVAVLAAAAPF